MPKTHPKEKKLTFTKKNTKLCLSGLDARSSKKSEHLALTSRTCKSLKYIDFFYKNACGRSLLVVFQPDRRLVVNRIIAYYPERKHSC